ncbi:MAG TPA: hypothetical protein VJN63_09835 [Thermoplasmata archaeon]|nr:hypothetical protein [Thermoplasmata archaeon]
MIVRATRVGFYNGRRRYPAGHGHADSGKPFHLIPMEYTDPKTKKKMVLTPEQQFSLNWMEMVNVKESSKGRKPKVEIEDAVDPSEVPIEEARGAKDAPPGLSQSGSTRNHPSTLSEMAKESDRQRDSRLRDSDEDMI